MTIASLMFLKKLEYYVGTLYKAAILNLVNLCTPNQNCTRSLTPKLKLFPLSIFSNQILQPIKIKQKHFFTPC
jgi:hypothetical protein